MKKTFAFLTKDSFRVDVLATTPAAAYKKLLDIPFFSEKITKTFIEYSSGGYASIDSWRNLEDELKRAAAD